MADHIVVVNQSIMTPDNRPYWITPEIVSVAENNFVFATGTVAEAFFGVPVTTLRWWLWKENLKGGLKLDGSPFAIRQINKNRVFTIGDIERLGHALAQAGHIDGDRLGKIVLMVKTHAQLAGMLL
jgi:hypothetical protein